VYRTKAQCQSRWVASVIRGLRGSVESVGLLPRLAWRGLRVWAGPVPPEFY